MVDPISNLPARITSHETPMTEPVTPSRVDSPQPLNIASDSDRGAACGDGGCHGEPEHGDGCGAHGHAHDHGRWGGERIEVAFAAVAALCAELDREVGEDWYDPATGLGMSLALLERVRVGLAYAVRAMAGRCTAAV